MAMLEVNHLAIQFGGLRAVDGFNVSIEKGQLYGLIGPNGAGKTTIFNLLTGVYKPTEGIIKLDGQDITALAANERKLNTVFQKYSLFPHMSIAENIAFGLKISKKSKAYIQDKIKYALKLVNLEGFENRSVDSLSGGQQQRTAIGRAIVKNPDILLCDEPTGALDYNTSKEILKLIETVNQKYGNTVVMVTHNDAIKDMADRVVRIRDGMIRKNYLNEHKVSAEALDW